MSNSINKMALSYILNSNDNELGAGQKTVLITKSVPEQTTALRGAQHRDAMVAKFKKNVSSTHMLMGARQNLGIQKQKNAENKLSKASALFKNADRSDSTNRRLIKLFAQGLSECVQGLTSCDALETSQALADVADLVSRSGDIGLAIDLLNASIEIKQNHCLTKGSEAGNISVLEGALQLLDFARSSSRSGSNLEYRLR